ncbi:MAG: polysaccharide deacetylase family protein [Angustibacter sp.]
MPISLPTVGQDSNVWGAKLNQAIADLEAGVTAAASATAALPAVARTGRYADLQGVPSASLAYRTPTPQWMPWVRAVTQFQAGHPFTAAGLGAATNLAQPGASRFGSLQVALVTDGTGGVGTLTGTGLPACDLTIAAQNFLRLWLRTTNMQQLADLRVRASDAGGLAAGRYAEWTLCDSGTTQQGPGQQEIIYGNVLTGYNLAPADAAITGTPNLASITEWRFLLADRNNAAGAQTLTLNGLEVLKSGVPTFGTAGVLALTFDDSAATQFSAARQTLAKYGAQATIFPIVDVVDTPGYMTEANIRALQADGHEIGIHAYSKALHDTYNTLNDPAQAEVDFRLAAEWSAARGFSAASFAYPQGWFFPSGDPARQFFSNGRTVLNRLAKTQPLPAVDPYRVRSISSVGGAGSTNTAASLTSAGGVLERVSAANAATVLTFHEIVNSAPTIATQCLQSDLDAVLDKARALGMAIVPFGRLTHP